MKTTQSKYAYKNQHYIPKSYLSAWVDPNSPENHEPYVWVFPRNGGAAKPKAPKNVFSENNIYTIPSSCIPGGRDLKIEQALKSLEDSFIKIRSCLLDNKKSLNSKDRANLLLYLTSLQWRTPSARQQLREHWTPVLKLGEELLDKAKSWSPEQKERASRYSRVGITKEARKRPNLSLGQVREIVENPLQKTIAAHIRAQTPLLANLNMTILCSTGNAKFITSDAPVVWYDPESRNRPPMHQNPALIYNTLNITLPLSPTRLLLLSYVDFPEYSDVPDIAVHRANCITRAYSKSKFVAQSSKADPSWYDNKPPA